MLGGGGVVESNVEGLMAAFGLSEEQKRRVRAEAKRLQREIDNAEETKAEAKT